MSLKNPLNSLCLIFASSSSTCILRFSQTYLKIHYFDASYFFLHISIGPFLHIYSHFTVRQDKIIWKEINWIKKKKEKRNHMLALCISLRYRCQWIRNMEYEFIQVKKHYSLSKSGRQHPPIHLISTKRNLLQGKQKILLIRSWKLETSILTEFICD